MPNIAALPGFRDFYPEDLAVRNHIVKTWREVARRYGFQEYDGPPLEPVDLYVKDSGTEILQQTYNFTDKGGREVALRPEMTPTFARMVGARAGGLRKPIKWFAIPQLFRYERAQRGRLREHFQLNLDIVGEPGLGADAELMAAAIDTLRAFGLTSADFVLRFSDRRLLRALLVTAGVPEDRLALVYNIVDKLEREPPERIAQRLAEETQLDPTTTEAVLHIFDRREFDGVREAYGEVPAVAEEIARIEELLSDLEARGLLPFVEFDFSIVRGLAYYTGVVFEIFDQRRELRAIAGGGRYDDLLRAVSGVDLPALGFGMGDVVLRELLDARGLLPERGASLDAFVVAVEEGQRGHAIAVVQRLRECGRAVEFSLRHQGVGKQLKAASALGARRTVVIGPDEVAEGTVVVRLMATGEEVRVPLAEVERVFAADSA